MGKWIEPKKGVTQPHWGIYHEKIMVYRAKLTGKVILSCATGIIFSLSKWSAGDERSGAWRVFEVSFYTSPDCQTGLQKRHNCHFNEDKWCATCVFLIMLPLFPHIYIYIHQQKTNNIIYSWVIIPIYMTYLSYLPICMTYFRPRTEEKKIRISMAWLPGRLDGEIFGSSERAPEQRVALSVDGDRSTPGAQVGSQCGHGKWPIYSGFSHENGDFPKKKMVIFP